MQNQSDKDNIQRTSKLRHSLQPKGSPNQPEAHNPLRYTQSQNFSKSKSGKRKSNPTVPPAIIEQADEEAVGEKEKKSHGHHHHHVVLDVEPERSRSASRLSKTNSQRSIKSTRSTKSTKSHQQGYDNEAFEGPKSAPRESVVSNATSYRTSSRDPSIQSSIVYEQYCCCSRRTKCEKILIATVSILTFIILVLIIVIGILASEGDLPKKTLLYIKEHTPL